MRKYFLAIFTILLVISSCKFKDSILTEAPADTTSTATSTSIKVLTPNGGETISEGSNFSITWSSTSKSLMRITFSYDNGSTWILVADSLKNTGVFNWFPVPNNISNQCIVRILSVDGVYSDASDKVFAIIRNSNESLNILSPNEKDEWEAGTSKQIKWYSSGLDSIKIEYTTNNGTSWNFITTDKKNTGIYYWDPIPNTPSVLAKVRIKDAKDGQPSSESQIFSILPEPKLKVISPNGKEKILAGTSRKLEWLSENVERVKIAYTTNNGFNWVSITESTPSTGFYVWEPVPNVNSQLCKIRVADAKDSQPFDMSDSVFTITNLISQTIEINTPNGGERWQAGTSQNLTWQSSGIQKVKIELTSNNGLTWNTIADNVNNTGAYEWNVPNSLSTQCLIRISDAQDGDPTDQSNGLFRIVPKPELKVIYPNGGETWTAGVVDTIRWQSIGVENVIIQSSSNNGITWFTIVEKTPSSGSYVTSFSKEGTEYKIRIHDKENGSPQDESDGTFTVSPEPKITVISPNGNEEWHAGSSDNITWRSNNIEFVRIDYTTNNGATWFNIIDKTPSDGVYSWSPIPSVSSLLCRVKISDYKDGLPADISDENFSIIYPGNQLIKVTLPNGGEKWAAGSSQNIKWDASGITSVKIEYTTNNGILWNTITSSTESDGFYTWTQVPNSPSTNCKIRISDAVDGSPSDESDLFFNIEPAPSIKVITPNGNDTWITGSTKEIKWTSENVENVKIEYTINGGATWISIANSISSSGSYFWNTIPNVNSLQCKIRISDALYGSPFDVSDDNFAIMMPGAQQISVKSPNGTEEWRVGSSQNITWDAGGIANVKIEYTTNNGLNWNTITSSTESDGFYSWNQIPNSPSTNCKIRISDAQDGNPFDDSDAFFSILPAPNLNVISPNGGETLQAGGSFEILWTSEGIENVKIEYTVNGGANWSLISNSTSSSGSYVWRSIPSINSQLCRIRISDALSGSPSDLSDKYFQISDQIAKSLRLLAPNGGEKWTSGSTQEISWSSSGISKVKIEFTSNNGSNWNTIIDNLNNGGTYSWSVPLINSSQCRIRVADAVGGDPYDESNSSFSIKPVASLTFIQPQNGTTILAGQPFDIQWNSSGIQYIKIQYNPKNSSFQQDWITIGDSIPNSNHFTTSFTQISESYVLRISEAGNVSNYFTSGVFKVIEGPTIKVLYPNQGEQWLVNEPYEIKWNASNIKNVKIEWTTTGGGTWNTVRGAENTTNDGLFRWIPADEGLDSDGAIPDSSDNCRIRISSVDNGVAASDMTDEYFSIHKSRFIRINYPNTGEDFYKSNSEKAIMAIGWTSFAVSTVDIYYSIDNGVTWNLIVAGYQSTGGYPWDYPPTEYSTQGRIRIVDSVHPAIADVNDVPFWLNIKKTGN